MKISVSALLAIAASTCIPMTDARLQLFRTHGLQSLQSMTTTLQMDSDVQEEERKA